MLTVVRSKGCEEVKQGTMLMNQPMECVAVRLLYGASN